MYKHQDTTVKQTKCSSTIKLKCIQQCRTAWQQLPMQRPECSDHHPPLSIYQNREKDTSTWDFYFFSSTIFMCPQEATEIEWVGRKLSQMHFQIHTNSASSISELLSNSCGSILLMSPGSRQQHRKISTCLEAWNSWMHLCLF